MSKILVDTNILVYGIDEDSAFFKRARKLLEQEKNQLVTTSKNLVEFLAVYLAFYHFSSSQLPNRLNAKPLTACR